MTPVPTSLTPPPTRLERLQEIRALLHETYPGRKNRLLHDLIDVCVDQELEIQSLKAQIESNRPDPRSAFIG